MIFPQICLSIGGSHLAMRIPDWRPLPASPFTLLVFIMLLLLALWLSLSVSLFVPLMLLLCY